jgi:hypothetical protein
MQHTSLQIGDVGAFRVIHATTALEMSRYKLSIGIAHVHGWAVVGLHECFFFLLPLFSLFSLEKYRRFLSFDFYIQFDPHFFFIVICFAFDAYWSLFFYSILSLSISFHLIFVSNLTLIWLLLFSFLSWFIYVFQFFPSTFNLI